MQTSFLVLITDLLPDEITCVKPYSLPSTQGTLSVWVPFLLRMSHPALVKLSRSIISFSHNGSPSLTFPLLFLSCTSLSGHWLTKRPATKGSHSSLSPTHTMLQGLPPLNMAQNTSHLLKNLVGQHLQDATQTKTAFASSLSLPLQSHGSIFCPVVLASYSFSHLLDPTISFFSTSWIITKIFI